MTTLLSIALIICFAICGGLAWQFYKLQQSLQQRDKDNRRMHQDLHGLIQCMHGVRDRFEKQQRQLRNVSVLQNDIAAGNTHDSNYQHAVLLMNKGATVDELVETCGLSQGEAELIDRLNELDYEAGPSMVKATA